MKIFILNEWEKKSDELDKKQLNLKIFEVIDATEMEKQQKGNLKGIKF